MDDGAGVVFLTQYNLIMSRPQKICPRGLLNNGPN